MTWHLLVNAQSYWSILMSYHFATYKKLALPEHLYLYPVVISIPKDHHLQQTAFLDSHDPYKMNSDSTLSSGSFFKDPLVFITLLSNLDHGWRKLRSLWAFLRSWPKKTMFWNQSFAPTSKLRPQSHSESNSQPITVFDTKSLDSHVNIHTCTYLSYWADPSKPFVETLALLWGKYLFTKSVYL